MTIAPKVIMAVRANAARTYVVLELAIVCERLKSVCSILQVQQYLDLHLEVPLKAPCSASYRRCSHNCPLRLR
jgi:hypothetical protein